MAVKTFWFTAGPTGDDAALSASAVVHAENLEEAKDAVRGAVAEIEDPGGVEGVMLVYDDNGVRMHVRLPDKMIDDDANWEEE